MRDHNDVDVDTDIRTPNVDVRTPNVDVRTPNVDARTPNVDVRTPRKDCFKSRLQNPLAQSASYVPSLGPQATDTIRPPCDFLAFQKSLQILLRFSMTAKMRKIDDFNLLKTLSKSSQNTSKIAFPKFPRNRQFVIYF